MQAYDLVPYPSVALPQTHPDRLATHARLFGLEAAPVEACRVLSVGCGDGANLIPMAAMLPESTFVGIDLAERPITHGREAAAGLELANVELHALDVEALPDTFGLFDYVIAHGFYSWVPDGARDALLRTIRAHLAPNGVAFVSYNALPGGHTRRMTRDMMLYHTEDIGEPDRRVAQSRALLDFLIDAQPEASTYRAVLEEERTRSHAYTATHFYHDHIADTNRAFYFHEFVEHAGRHELRYLGEADFAAMSDRTFPPETRAALDQLRVDPIRREQYMDFIRNRMFRQTLLVHAAAAVEAEPTPRCVAALAVAAPIRALATDESSDDVTFESDGGKSIRTIHPFAKAVCTHIAAAWPAAVRVEALWATVENDGFDDASLAVLAAVLLDFYRDGFVRLHTHAPTLVGAASERPVALRLARRQAASAEDDGPVTNGWHTPVALDAEQRRVLALLDGQHDRAALLSGLNEGSEHETTSAELNATLRWLARHAMLVA